MSSYFQYEILTPGIYKVNIGYPEQPINILNRRSLEDLNEVLEAIETDPEAKGVIFKSIKSDFIVGSDVSEYSQFLDAEKAYNHSIWSQEIFDKISNLEAVTIAAIDGVCLNIGLELALACDWRIAANNEKTLLGFTEIDLGLIPSLGGTQKTPYLIGIESTLEMVLKGHKLAPKKALKMGLVDAICHPADIDMLAKSFLSHKNQRSPKVTKKISNLPRWAIEKNSIGRKILEKKLRDSIKSYNYPNYPATLGAIDSIFRGYNESLKKGSSIEARIFADLTQTKEAHCLIHIFNSEQAVIKKINHHINRSAKKIETVGLIGAGFMGAGITAVCGEKGIRVRLSDPNKEAIGRCLNSCSEYFNHMTNQQVGRGIEYQRKMAHISPCTSYSGINRCDIVLEAVFEDLELKQNILNDIEKRCSPDLIFASNTSTIPISQIASKAKNPERVIGMHFFSPVEQIPLLEIVRTPETSNLALAKAISLGRSMDKKMIVVQDSPGFFSTRTLAFFLAEAALLIEEGASPSKIDKCLTDFGFSIGPVTLMDEIGIDVTSYIFKMMRTSFLDTCNQSSCVDALLESGRLGVKNNKGFYSYKRQKKGLPDPFVQKLIGIEKQREISEIEITERCLLSFINEAARCLEEGILSSAYDGDLGSIYGLGFPAYRGGPFKYIDQMGSQNIVDRMFEVADNHGNRNRPCQLLIDHAVSGKQFFPKEL